MELRQLRYLVAVIDAQSITRACDALNVVPSAVSQQLKLLEEELGSLLLIRGPLGVQPTSAGKTLYSHAHTILRQVLDARDSVRLAEDQIAGSVSVAIASSTAQALTVPLLVACRTQFPAVALSIHEGLSGLLVEGVFSGRFDMAVLYASEATRKLNKQAIVREPFFFGSSEPKALAMYRSGATMSLEELAHWPLWLPSVPNATRSALDRAFARLEIRYSVAGEVNSPTSHVGAVRAGMASSVFPWVSLQWLGENPGVVVRPLDSSALYRDVVLAHKEQPALNRAGSAVRSLLARLLEELYAPLLSKLD